MNGSTGKEDKHNIFRELINGDLPAEEKKLPRLRDEGQTMIAAGQETSSFFLQQASYFILADPVIHTKLVAELEEAIPNPESIPPLATLEKLAYLHAVVQETHRFSHGVTGRLERISPDTPLRYVKLMGGRVIECLRHLLTLLPINLGTRIGLYLLAHQSP
jgi:cytochrome P450